MTLNAFKSPEGNLSISIQKIILKLVYSWFQHLLIGSCLPFNADLFAIVLIMTVPQRPMCQCLSSQGGTFEMWLLKSLVKRSVGHWWNVLEGISVPKFNPLSFAKKEVSFHHKLQAVVLSCLRPQSNANPSRTATSKPGSQNSISLYESVISATLLQRQHITSPMKAHKTTHGQQPDK